MGYAEVSTNKKIPIDVELLKKNKFKIYLQQLRADESFYLKMYLENINVAPSKNVEIVSDRRDLIDGNILSTNSFLSSSKSIKKRTFAGIPIIWILLATIAFSLIVVTSELINIRRLFTKINTEKEQKLKLNTSLLFIVFYTFIFGLAASIVIL